MKPSVNCIWLASEMASGRRTWHHKHLFQWINRLTTLDMTDRRQFRTAVTVHRRLHGVAAAFLTLLCITVSQTSSCRRLRSTVSNQLVVPSA